MSAIYTLLEGNRQWVERELGTDPDFFESLAKQQAPKFLWIGCSDSRVPATQITNAKPGSIFVQRNIANVVVHTDSNLLTVVKFAIGVLKVDHIIVCGHYGCGGVQAAMTNEAHGFLDNWLAHIKDVYLAHQSELDGIGDIAKRHDRFVELNVVEQVKNLAKISFVQEEWASRNAPQIHGWVYSLQDGMIKDLNVTMSSNESLESIYRYQNHTSMQTD